MLVSIFIYSAVIGGMFLLVQFAMVFLGDDAGDARGVDGGDDFGHAHGAGSMFFEIFSLRTIAAAVTFFGLVGMAVHRSGGSETQAVVAGVVAGIAALYSVFLLYRQLYRLQSSGNQDIRNAVGLPAQVYIPIPPTHGGRGKVQFKMQGRIVEYQALTEDEDALTTGETVYIQEVISSDTVLVSRSLPQSEPTSV